MDRIEIAIVQFHPLSVREHTCADIKDTIEGKTYGKRNKLLLVMSKTYVAVGTVETVQFKPSKSDQVSTW